MIFAGVFLALAEDLFFFTVLPAAMIWLMNLLISTCCSQTYQLLKRPTKTIGQLRELIMKIEHDDPKIFMNIVCYHTEYRG
jgi:aminoglycoside N3'-acetyltransferase